MLLEAEHHYRLTFSAHRGAEVMPGDDDPIAVTIDRTAPQVTLQIFVSGDPMPRWRPVEVSLDTPVDIEVTSEPGLQVALEGRAPKKVIHAGGRLVNIVG